LIILKMYKTNNAKWIFKEIYEKRNETGDVRFVFSAENEKINAHKLILASASKYFENRFYGSNQKECEEIEIEINEDVSANELAEKDIIAILSLLARKKNPHMKQFIRNELNQLEIRVDNVGKIYSIAQNCECEELQNRCLSFIEFSSQVIINNIEVFVSFPLELVDKIIKSDTFFAEEIKIFMALNAWKMSNANCDISDLFNYIRYQYITDEDLEQHVYKLVDPSRIACIVYSFRKNFSQRKIPETSIDAFAGKNQVDKKIEKQEMKVNLCEKILANLFTNELLKDVVIKCENFSFAAQKLILNVATDLSFPLIDVRVDEIDFSDFSFQTFQMMIDYVYTGFINLSGQNKYDLYELYLLARKVRVKELLDEVDEQIRKIEIEPFNTLNLRIEEFCKKIEKIEEFGKEIEKIDEKVNTLVELNPAPIRNIAVFCGCDSTWRDYVSHYKCSKIYKIEFEFYEVLEESQIDFNFIAENVQEEESFYIYVCFEEKNMTCVYKNKLKNLKKTSNCIDFAKRKIKFLRFWLDKGYGLKITKFSLKESRYLYFNQL
ncbi:BTB/POZ domain-containing protein 9-like protein, partial [Dinothrombium tinctorium]